MRKITLMAAVAENGCIGKDNAMLWHLPEDFAFFKAYTMGKTVVMGRKTWDSLPRKPLSGRRNLVVSRRSDLLLSGAEVCSDLAAVWALTAGEAETVVIGGGEIYAQALPYATDLRLTEVRLRPDGDAFFPRWEPALWQELARECHRDEASGTAFDFVHYVRNSGAAD